MDMPHRPFLTLRRPYARRILRAAALLLATFHLAAVAQPAEDTVCRDALVQAESRYVSQDYTAIEALTNDCLYHPAALDAERQQAYRLQALAFIKQDLLAEAQMTIVKLLGMDYAYEADAIQDPPVYVALVSAVKDQLRVTTEPQRSGLLDINTASAQDLEALDGIGPVLAQRILAYRRANGAFRAIEDLQNVQGIGPRTYERFAAHITIDPQASTYSVAGGVSVEPVPPRPLMSSEDEPMASRETAPVSRLVNINTATAEELESLGGIGPVLAQRILDYRRENGVFHQIAELQEVRGIGPRTLERLAPFVTVGDAE